MANSFGFEMSDEQEQMSDASDNHVRVTGRPFTASNLEYAVAVTEPELNSHTSSKFPNKLDEFSPIGEVSSIKTESNSEESSV
jgi:hypothetical protein